MSKLGQINDKIDEENNDNLSWNWHEFNEIMMNNMNNIVRSMKLAWILLRLLRLVSGLLNSTYYFLYFSAGVIR